MAGIKAAIITSVYGMPRNSAIIKALAPMMGA